MPDACDSCGRSDVPMAIISHGECTTVVNGKRVGTLCSECFHREIPATGGMPHGPQNGVTGPEDPSHIVAGLPPIFEQKMREHAEVRRMADQVKLEEDERIAAGGTATPWAKRRGSLST